MNRYEAFQGYGTRMNCRILGDDIARAGTGAAKSEAGVAQGATLVTKRFFSLDTQTYQAGALDIKTKELVIHEGAHFHGACSMQPGTKPKD